MKIGALNITRQELTDEEWAAHCEKALPVMQHWLESDREMRWLGITLTAGCANGVSQNPGVVTVASSVLDIVPFNVFMWGMGTWPVTYWNPDPDSGFEPALFMSRVVANTILAEIGLQLAQRALQQARPAPEMPR